MSRLKDLRELICVSRLTYRESDEEVISDEETSKAFDKLHISGKGSGVETPDSGTGDVNDSTAEAAGSKGAHASDQESQKRKRKKKHRAHSSKSESDDAAEGRYDELLCYLDSSTVSQWLVRSNEWVKDLSVWCHTGSNYIDIANFMLTEFPDNQRQKILELEYSIFMDEVTIAFSAGQHTGQVTYRKLQHLALAVFREYPSKLLSERGKRLFLDYLDILSSEKTEKYRSLLSDVKVSTQNRQYAQLLLAVRAFGLSSLWFAVVNFYRKLKAVNAGMVDVAPAPSPSNTELLELTTKDQTVNRLLQAIKYEYIHVVEYFLDARKLDVAYRDEHGRSLLHIAIMNNRERVLEYLLTRSDTAGDVDVRARNGNTPLHAAINNGNQNMVRLLLRHGRVDCNLCNPLCDNAAPLHLAIMHGYKTIVAALLDAGADPKAKMGDLDALAMADEFSQEEIKNILLSRLSE